jgi:hypothetical protein
MEANESIQQGGEETQRYGVIGGLLAAPVTAISYWQTGSEVSFVPIFLIALVTGYVAKRRSVYDRGIGARVGVVGGLPVLWAVYNLVGPVLGLANPPWFTVVSVALLGGFTLLALGVAVVLGEVAARVGHWLADHSDRNQRVSHSHQ